MILNIGLLSFLCSFFLAFLFHSLILFSFFPAW